ncbi:hypothetical protein M951_chr295 (nucleomorph) [Lotharella oceanica]|uniref:Uncharacterized protein n=1 Tax=Lotharella oceanica TaxID=641309 RepID=A0A060DG77_9EUKA|nr:hypothetical protein M951_chr295 [Lotharella oceanica]|mmetsp:Transcript_16960/g.32167  ORF Transcript_16960/g.32167 Transcript_16960/m.32167 type:complete len:93 (-) Transcript_16960:838-1116(-)
MKFTRSIIIKIPISNFKIPESNIKYFIVLKKREKKYLIRNLNKMIIIKNNNNNTRNQNNIKIDNKVLINSINIEFIKTVLKLNNKFSLTKIT